MSQNRTPEGVPTGGQFAGSAKSESGVRLNDDGSLHPTEAHPPSTNPQTGDFGRCTTLLDLEISFEGATSPENISWDGERKASALDAEMRHLRHCYDVRRTEIDPNNEYKACFGCNSVVATDLNGSAVEHEILEHLCSGSDR